MEVIRVETAKASPTGDHEVPDLEIVATRPVEEFRFIPDALDTQRQFFEGEAEKIVDAMGRCLPGGLCDAILRELLLQRRYDFRVPMIEPEAR